MNNSYDKENTLIISTIILVLKCYYNGKILFVNCVSFLTLCKIMGGKRL